MTLTKILPGGGRCPHDGAEANRARRGRRATQDPAARPPLVMQACRLGYATKYFSVL